MKPFQFADRFEVPNQVIARRLGLTRARVDQIIVGALAKIRKTVRERPSEFPDLVDFFGPAFDELVAKDEDLRRRTLEKNAKYNKARWEKTLAKRSAA